MERRNLLRAVGVNLAAAGVVGPVMAQMPAKEKGPVEPMVERSIKNWGPRFVQQGIDFNDYQRTVAKIETWEGWLGPWLELGEKHEQLAKVAEQKGNKQTAGEEYLVASLAIHFGKYLSPNDPQYVSATKKSVELMGKAHKYLDPAAERIEIPYKGEYIVGNFRRPSGANRSPLVILAGGLDSTKEEFFSWENTFHARGIATLSIDGPGQGEVGIKLPLAEDYESTVGAFIDDMAKRKSAQVDISRIGICGVSAGGYRAPRAAAFESRIKAAAACGGVYDNHRVPWEKYDRMLVDKLMFDARTKDINVAQAWHKRIDTLAIADRVKQPFLMVHGNQDWAYPLDLVRNIAKVARASELVVIEGGNHVVSNYPYLWRPLVADWMKEKLG